MVDQIYFFRDDIDSGYMVVLGKKNRKRQADIAGSGNGDVILSGYRNVLLGSFCCRGVIHDDICDLETKCLR